MLPLRSYAQAIIGGQDFDIKDAPYLVSLEADSGLVTRPHFCGGAILSNRWILTAAHCLPNYVPSDITIHAGSTDLSNDAVGQRVGVQAIYLHPASLDTSMNFRNYFDNDIALLYLAEPLHFNHAVMPIEYANPCNTNLSDFAPGVMTLVAGWGVDCVNCPGIPVLDSLQAAYLPIVDTATARARIDAHAIVSCNINITQNMISLFQPGVNTSFGDSGGPVVIDKNGNKIEVGLVSWGCTPRDSIPSFYTKVYNYDTWIENTTGLAINPANIDLYTKDKPWDTGPEPFSTPSPWTSEDIWIRRQNDGVEEHQNPEYYTQAGNSNYVYIRVRNRGCLPSLGNEKLKLYWAKAGTALSWPNHWNGSMSVAGQSLGDSVGEITLPVIQPGDAYIATIPWNPPNPANFVGLASDPVFWADEPHHFCLLSRIVGTSDPMNTPETNSVADNVLNNNNIAWKNFSVVDLDPLNIGGGVIEEDRLVGASVLVGDAWDDGGIYDLEFKNPDYLDGEPVTASAEVKITLDAPVWTKWEQGGFEGTGIDIVDIEKHQVMLSGSYGKLKNLSFTPNERGLIHTSFNFLTDEIHAESAFQFEVNQLLYNSDSVVGGELFQIAVPDRTRFYAHAGSDQTINAGELLALSAGQINEDVIYNWYDDSGKRIHSGQSFSLSPTVTQKYKLEVIAKSDGFKDYDEVNITVKENFISSISPNPPSANMQVAYRIANSVS